MKRKLYALSVVTLMFFALSIPAVGHHKPGHSGGPPHLTTTTTIASTTTTTQATTTTVASTTTLATTTTTTTLVGEIPPTLSVNCVFPSSVREGSCFAFESSEGDDESTVANECDVNGNPLCEPWWQATYVGDRDGPGGDPHVLLPYPAGAMWGIGDRIAYCGAYTPIRRGSPTGPAFGSATFVKVLGSTYTKINDRGMVEGDYFWNGDPTPADTVQAYRPSWCGRVANTDYGTYTGPDTNPLIAFFDAGVHAENRDYRNVVRRSPSDSKFKLVEFITEPFWRSDFGNVVVNGNCIAVDCVERQVLVNQRATVVFFWDDNSAEVVYYDAFGTGSLQVIEDAA